MAISLSFLLLVSSLLLLLPITSADFTFVMPDSSALVDGPQSGFSDRARTDPAEQLAVYEVMAATGNPWAASIPDVCRGRWHGIECMPDADDVYHVVSLSFGALSDDTAFPTCDASRNPYLSPALLRLPHLRTLFLYRCLSPQPIPPFLGRLGSALRSLVLRENRHVGPIPAELGNLTSLRTLDLHGNLLRSSIPNSLSFMTRLQLLDLSGNQLEQEIPNLILPSLTILDLSHNLLSGHITNSSLFQCESLIKMDLSRNQLAGPIPESVSGLRSLTLLDFSHNRLSGPLPSSLGSLANLQSMNLKGNLMASTMLPAEVFVGLKGLITLVLSGMGLKGTIPESIADLPSLRVLHLDGNELNGSIPWSFGRLGKLTELRINDNRLSGPIPFGREMLWRMGRKLKVYNNSGLCYDAGNGGIDGVEALSGIGRCNANKMTGEDSGPTKHLSASSIDQRPVIDHSSFSGGCHVQSSNIGVLVLMAGFLLYVLLPVL